MPRVATVVPAEIDILCEGCGYTLNGLPETGNCPECGKPIDDSRTAAHRVVPASERSELPTIRGFIQDTIGVILRPTRFFQTLQTRRDNIAARRFARAHWLLSALLLGAAAVGHHSWHRGFTGPALHHLDSLGDWILLAVLSAATYVILWLTTHLAARLTAWEAAYRGFRLPLKVVLRGLYFHAAHYLPVAAIAYLTVMIHRILTETGRFSPQSATIYLYILSAEVILGAAYLFMTYWIAMKNMMFANR